MNKRLIHILIIMLFSIILKGCTNVNASNNNSKETIKSEVPSSNQQSTDSKDKKAENTYGNLDKMTIDDVKANYTGGGAGQIVNLTTYGEQYVLVEYTYGSYRQFWDFYNLKTGDKDILPVNNAKLNKIIDTNDIRFITDGIYAFGVNVREFPKVVECIRDGEVMGYDRDFIQIPSSFYIQIDQAFDMGEKRKETIVDIKVSLKGIEVLFESRKGMEAEFYAGSTTVPYTKTRYDKEKNQFIIEFEDVDIDNKLDISKINQQNRYIESINIERNDLNTIMVIDLKDTAKYYMIDSSRLEPTVDDFPCLNFNFANEYKIE